MFPNDSSDYTSGFVLVCQQQLGRKGTFHVALCKILLALARSYGDYHNHRVFLVVMEVKGVMCHSTYVAVHFHRNHKGVWLPQETGMFLMQSINFHM
jgi:hypothetical protein